MNLDQIIESLGLDKLGSASSTRGRAGQADGTPAEDGQPFDPAEDSMGDDPPDLDEPGDDWEEAPPAHEPADDVAGEVVAPAVQEVRHDVDELSAEVDSNASALRGIESQQDEVLERLERIEEHNARLLGVYDRLTAGINPFDEDWDVKYDQARGDEAEDDEHRYGVIEPPDDVEGETQPGGAGGGTVSFEDLKQKHGEPESTVDEASESEAREEPGDDVEPSSPAPQPAAVDGHAYLSALAPSYATDVLLMEWLTMLIEIAGAPGALKALEYYESIDWISEPVKRQVEDVLSGVEAPGDAQPRPPGDLTTEEHNQSFAYIMKLAQQRQPAPTRTE